MEHIIRALHHLGEDFEVNQRHIRVNFPWVLGHLDIKFDYAKNQWVYQYRQVRDVLLVFILFAYAAVTFSEHHFVIPMLMLAFALTRVMTSVLKEIRVMAIKQQVSATKASLASSITDT